MCNRFSAFLVEKPLALSLEESLKMESSAQRKNQIIGVAFVERFNPLIRKLYEAKKFPDSNMHYVFERIFPVPGQLWYQNPCQSGGPLLDIGIHDLDLLNWIVGRKPKIVQVKENNGIVTSELDFANGLSAKVISGWSKDGEIKNSISFNGIKLDKESLDKKRYPLAYRREIISFIDHVLGGAQEYPLIAEGIAALEVALRIRKQLATRLG